MSYSDEYLENITIDPMSGKKLWVIDLAQHFKAAKKMNTKKPIILRGQKSGRKMHIAFAKLEKNIGATGGPYKSFYNKVNKNYRDSGWEAPDLQKSFFISGNGPYPLHNSRDINQKAQSLLLNKIDFESLCDPKLGGKKYIQNGLMIRDDTLDLKKGAVRLKERADDPNKNITGWELETKITDIKRMSVSDIEQLDDRTAHIYGFANTREMVDQASKIFTGKNKDPRDRNNTLILLTLAPINPHDTEYGMTFYDPTVTQISVLER